MQSVNLSKNLYPRIFLDIGHLLRCQIATFPYGLFFKNQFPDHLKSVKIGGHVSVSLSYERHTSHSVEADINLIK